MTGFSSFGGVPLGGLSAPPSPPSPPTPTVISTALGSVFARVPSVSVAFSSSLLGPWDTQANLYLDRLRICAAPEIEQATLTWYYGTIMQPGATTFTAVNPLDNIGDYIRVQMENWWVLDYGTTNLGSWDASTNTPTLASGVGNEGDRYTVSVTGATSLDGETDWPAGAVLVFKSGAWIKVGTTDWYGKVETESLRPDGNFEGVSTGTQTLTCFGPLRWAEQKIVATTFVENYDASDMIEINRGLKFNEDERGEIRGHGNRSATKQTIPDQPGATPVDSYLFSWKERGQDEWSAEEAVTYLLCAHARDITPDVPWRLVIDSGNLQWNPKGGLVTDRKSLKALLDDLISRHRGVGYEVHFDPIEEEIVCRVFSFSDVDIAMPNGETFDANPDQYSLDFEASFDVQSPELTNTLNSRFHRVVIEGDWMTSTATVRLDTVMQKDWTSADETAFLAGATGESWYASLDTTNKRQQNKIARNEDRFSHVFSRFRVYDEWDLTVTSMSGLFTDLRVFPELDIYNGAGLVSDTADWQIWIPGLTITDKLTLRERYDYSGDKIETETWEASSDAEQLTAFLEPFSFWNSQLGRGETWELLDKMDVAIKDKPAKRKWRVDTHAHSDRPAVNLNVIGGQQQFLALADWDGAAVHTADDAPVKHGGIDWRDIAVTLTFEFTERARIERVISIPPAGELERVLRVHVQDCRLDYVVPNTVVGVKSGELQYSDGGFVRDDRLRLDTLCKAASIWYGKPRQPLDMAFKQVRPIVEVGWLIVDVGSTYQKTAVNSVVTACTFDLNAKTFSFQSTYAELDLL